MAEFVTSQKKQRKIIHEGYVYVLQKELANDLRSFECVLRRKGECKAKIKVSLLDDVVGQVNEHTHQPSNSNCEVVRLKSLIKDRSEQTRDNPQQILAETLANASETAATSLPRIEHLRRTIRSQRKGDENRPANPINRATVPALPELYQQTLNGEQFLLFDSGVGDANRILIFSTHQAIQLMATSEHWFGDGTFKVCPEIFFQLYTLHVKIDQRIIPCVYALLPNKTQHTYTRMFQEVSNRVQAVGNTPLTILFDFEIAVINSASAVFEDIEIKGCFFHLSSNIWKHIQAAGLQERYRTNEEFALHLRMIAALAFVPPDDLVEFFDELCDTIRGTYNEEVDVILDYFEDTYIGRFRRNAPRAPPLFGIEIWNMFHRTHQEMPRTNNHIEGWHRRFQSLCMASHPTLWKFLDTLKKEQSMNRVEILQAEGGHPPPAQRRRYVDCNQRILTIVDDFPNRQHIRYLRGIAHNLTF
jgi:hypothetical protein